MTSMPGRDGLDAKLAVGVPPTPELRALSSVVGAASPRDIARLDAADSGMSTTAPSASSSEPGGSGGGSGSGSTGGGLRLARGSSIPSPVPSVGDLAEQPPLEVDLDFLCDRLKRGPLTGQVVAW